MILALHNFIIIIIIFVVVITIIITVIVAIVITSQWISYITDKH